MAEARLLPAASIARLHRLLSYCCFGVTSCCHRHIPVAGRAGMAKARINSLLLARRFGG